MNAEHWQQIDDLFQAALELEPRQRVPFLEKACSDDLAMRQKVEALLASDADGWNFIDTPALELAASFLADEQPQLTAGQLINHYEIIGLIGRGGMSEVYLARDKTLNRRIALKLLPADYTRDSDRLRRFQREAQAASALNHPNILTIHQLGDVDGQQFIATEFIEGQTLRERIKLARLSLSEALDLTIQITSALAAAHKAGIVHRDIKPENIMVRPDGYVKVLDFGLAKLTEQYERIPEAQAADNVDISSGVVLGTVKYMSPEQARGLMVDQRSDIFSLGAVLYEMVTGHAPFEADAAADLINSIITQEPTSVDEYLPNPPARFGTIVGKALSKNRETRYQTAEDMLIDLKILKEEIELEAKFSQSGPPQSAHAAQPASPAPHALPTPVASTVEYLINAFRGHKILTTITIVIVLAAISVLGYFSYKVRLRNASNFSRDKAQHPLVQTGRWTTRASISSARYQAEPAVLNGVLYVAGGWNVCNPYATLESYDESRARWIERAPMHTARGGHGVGVLNGLLYVVGGMVNCGVETSSVEAYDPETNTWLAKASLPTTRANHVVAVVNGKIYAIGGDAKQGSSSSAVTTEYDPATNTWTDRAPMPTPRRAAAAAVVNNVIYVLGGVFNSPVTTVEAYNPATNTWTAKASLPTPRVSFGAAAINGVIYAMGGPGNKGTVDVYDPATDSWSTATSMPAPRTSFHSTALDGSIYVAGGFDGVSYLSSVIAFTPDIPKPGAALCPASGSWTTKAPMPTMRGTMATGEINGIVYVVGGGPKFFATNEAYDPNTNTWTTKKPMPTARSMAGTNNAVVNGILYVIGNNTPGHCTNVNEAYDPSTDSWTTKAPMPTPRCHLSVVALDGLVYAIGGNSNNAFSSLVEVYHPATNAWTTAAPLPTARQTMAVGSVNGILYAVGGLDLSGPLDVVEAYNPVTNTWSTKARMPTPRQGPAAGVLNDSLVIVGGLAKDENGIATVEIYDPATDSWSTGAPMPTPRGYLSAATVNNTLYVLGNGAGPVAPLGTNEAYTVSCSH